MQDFERRSVCQRGRATPASQAHFLAQKKLKIGKPNDHYEREADRVAAHVASSDKSGETPAITKLGAGGLNGQAYFRTAQRMAEVDEEPAQAKLVQRTPEEEEPAQAKPVQRQVEEEEPGQAKLVQRAPEEEEPAQTKLVQRKESGTAVAARQMADRGSGRPMHEGTRSKLEASVGSSFSDVRIHDDARANSAADNLGARAFTQANHIWLSRSASDADVQLMAHEATHVVQQTGRDQKPRK